MSTRVYIKSTLSETGWNQSLLVEEQDWSNDLDSFIEFDNNITTYGILTDEDILQTLAVEENVHLDDEVVENYMKGLEHALEERKENLKPNILLIFHQLKDALEL
ncbi:CLUMA_CG013439, isoform A [Clunio marinus]|uniref:CLUMA_CG013439, isoform A n=1 Tax=Clunio marinus TaxID=568069 RepID=A0A1J1IIW2_9DIPT|nr:CLUMA_CG013439, isoform A [Clunio marinus]